MEIWKDIRGYTGLYQVSNTGKVKSLSKSWIGGTGGLRTKPDTILAQTNSNNYLAVNLRKDGKAKRYSVHTLVGKEFVDGYKPGLEINHKDGNKNNNNDWNLEWVTSKQNKQHGLSQGLYDNIINENSRFAKITKEDVIKIKHLIKNHTQKKVAQMFNITQSNVSYIVNNKSWKH